MMAFNNCDTIEQAIDSIFIQNGSFPIELVVGDDFSTDSTREVINSIQDSTNVSIKFLERPKNGTYYIKRHEGSFLQNFKDIISNCTGEYIAILDADDYWMNDDKILNQVKFLEDNSDYALVCSNVLVSNSNKTYPHSENVKSNFSFDQNELSTKNIIPTVSVIFRNDRKKIESFLQNIEFYEFGDYPLWFHLLSDGSKAMKLADVTAVYRVNEKGIFSGEKEIINRLKIVRNIQAIKETVELKPEIIKNLDEQILENLMIALRSKDWKPELISKIEGINLDVSAISMLKECSDVMNAEKEGLLRATPSKELVKILWQRFLSKFKL